MKVPEGQLSLAHTKGRILSLQRPKKQGRSRSSRKPSFEPLWETEARSGPRLEARAHILEAAAEAFMQRGYAATTLDHVAANLGTTKGQIYHYYRSKSDLYFDVVVGALFMINDATAQIAEQTSLSPAERLRRMATAHALSIVNHYAFQRVALEATQHHLIEQFSTRQDRAMSRILEFRDEYEARYAEVIREGRDLGEFEIDSISLATKAALGSLNWLTVWYDRSRPVGETTPQRIAGDIVEFVVAGLRPNPIRPDWLSAV